MWHEPMSAKVTNKKEMPDWYGKDLAGKVLVFHGQGRDLQHGNADGFAKKGLGPKAISMFRPTGFHIMPQSFWIYPPVHRR